VNLVSVEQLSYSEFLEGLPSPTCLVSVGLKPYDGNGVLELNPSLAFPIIEMLLGGSGKQSASIQRDITEIEQKLLDGLFRIILNDLREAWKGVTEIDFTIESMDTEPQLVNVLAPNEAVVAIGVEIRIAEAVGMMNIALPSIVIKMMRQKFEQQWSVRKTHASEAEQGRLLGMLLGASMTVEARLEGLALTVANLLALAEGHVMIFDRSIAAPVSLQVNGRNQYFGTIVNSGGKRSFAIELVREPETKEAETKEAPAAIPSPPGLPAPEQALAARR
jgi:flagellar motor switch protein FliM